MSRIEKFISEFAKEFDDFFLKLLPKKKYIRLKISIEAIIGMKRSCLVKILKLKKKPIKKKFLLFTDIK